MYNKPWTCIDNRSIAYTAWQSWSKVDTARHPSWQITGSYKQNIKGHQGGSQRCVTTTRQRIPVAPRHRTSHQSREGTNIGVHSWQQSSKRSDSSSYISWSCGRTNKSCDIALDPFGQNFDLQTTFGKNGTEVQERPVSSEGYDCEKVLSNAASFCCTKEWFSVSLTMFWTHNLMVRWRSEMTFNHFPAPVCNISGLNLLGHPCQQSIFWLYITSTLNATRFDENVFTCQCEKENKKA